MKEKSPIHIEQALFRAYCSDERNRNISEFDYDRRRDFVIGPDLAGFAIRLEFINDRAGWRPARGVRRRISATLIDAVSRCVIATQLARVVMKGGDEMVAIHVDFPASDVAFRAGNTYKLLVRDEMASETLDELFIRTYDETAFGDHPSRWYDVRSGSIRPVGGTHPFKTLIMADDEFYLLRFDMTCRKRSPLPMIMPELEIRIHYPDGTTDVRFAEPARCGGGSDRFYIEEPVSRTSYQEGTFYAEVLCMEYPVAGMAFSSCECEEEGEWSGDDIEPVSCGTLEEAIERFRRYIDGRTCEAEVFASDASETDDDRDEFEAALDRFIESEKMSLADEESVVSDDVKGEYAPLLSPLDHLTGLVSVKEKLLVYERVVSFNRMRVDKGLPASTLPLHAMFLGSPGTGKTTVAKIIGVMLRRAGILSKGHVVVRERATLLGQNYSSESENTRAAIEEAQGGILLIDEAYQLYQPDDRRDPGKFVIETLLTALADESNRDWMLILAGYPEEMMRMFEMNPGFRSRIPDSNIYTFDDFTESELVEIAEKYLHRHQYSIDAEAHDALTERLKADYSMRGRSFGNARHVINLIQTEILPAMAVRVTTEGLSDEHSLMEIRATDIPHPVIREVDMRHRVGFAV